MSQTDNSSTSRRQSSILDPIHPTLPPDLWDEPSSAEPKLKPDHAHYIKTFIYGVLDHHGYAKPETWLSLVLTGSLTTPQYGPNSDCDVSLFVNAAVLPEWSRAEMIGIMVSNADGHKLPGTPYPLQCFVVSKTVGKEDLYQPGLRSGYDIDSMHWLTPPEPDRAHDVQAQENGFYTYALEMADKMERLLRYEPRKAVQFWHAIHRRRSVDQKAGRGDFTESNIIYKFLAKRHLFPAIEQASGEHIAAILPLWGVRGIKTAWGQPEPDYTDPAQFQQGWTEGELGRKYPIHRNQYNQIHSVRRFQDPNELATTNVGQTHNEYAAQLAEMYAHGHIDEPMLAGQLGASQLYMTQHERTLNPQAVWNRSVLNTPEEWQDLLARRHQTLRTKFEQDPQMDSDQFEQQVGSANALAASQGVEPLSLGYDTQQAPRVAAMSHQSILDANAGQDLEGLPGPVNVPGHGPLQFHSNADIQRMAQDYNQQNGIPDQHPTNYTRVVPQIAQQVAQAFDQTQHTPNDPETRAAYEAFARESRQQYDHTIKNGYNFEFYPQGQDPYPNSPREAVLDLHHNKHMYVFPTQEGFGAEGDAAATQDHPMLGDSGVRWNGQPVTHNDLFRAVHDVYGHAKEGVGFRADGEDNAFRQHAAMFSPLAQRALTTETRGQNNWINHGPYGAQNQNANTADTIFAQNRAGLMPEWVGDPNLFQQTPQQPVAKVAMFQPITKGEARGNSRPVSHEEFQQLAAEGKAKHDALAANASPTTGLDAHWPAIKDHAYGEVLKPWGGATYDAHTGEALASNAEQYALTARPPGTPVVSLPENPDRDTFHAAMDQARAQYQPLLEREGHHLGVFHDNDEGRVDIDPILVVNSPDDVDRIGAYTHATGGAYNFATGQGHFPPHVSDATLSAWSPLS